MKKVVQDLTSGGIDWQREKWQSGLGSKFIHQGEKNATKYADEVIVLSKGVQDYFKETYGRKTHFIPNGVNRPQTREAKLITDKFGLKKDSYILFLGRLVPEKGIRYLVEAFKNVKTDKKLVIAGGSSDTDSFMMLFAFDEPEMIKVEEIVLPPKENTEEDEGETVKKKIYIFPPEWAGTFGQPITSIAQVGILRQEHYAGNWDVFRLATEIEEMNIFTAESLNELLREAEKIMEGWTDYR